jgi:DNA-binding SARP family transcriptional activator
MDFQVGILGPTWLIRAGQAVPLGGRRRSALLALLAARTNEILAFERLIEDLWEGRPPSHAATSLHSHLSRLRGALGSGRLLTVAAGYQLVLAEAELDAAIFASEVSAARAALSRGEPQRSIPLLDRALGRWRGAALSDAPGVAWAIAEARRLTELRQEGEELRLEARLAMGEHDGVVGDAEAAVAVAPLRERRWSHLMVALYRSRRQADALRAYQRLRSVLVDELGVEPSPELAQLEQRILAQDPALDAGPPGQPAAGQPSNRRAPGAIAAASVPARLTGFDRPGFVGRAAPLAWLHRAVNEVPSRGRRVVVLSGEPGIGKTTLLARFAVDAGGQGTDFWYGSCSAGGPPYEPFLEMLSTQAASTPAPSLAVLAGLEPERQGADRETQRYLLMRSVASIASEAARRRPLAIVVDDLHWAGPQTLALLRHLVAHTDPAARLTFIVAHRRSDTPPGVSQTLVSLGRDAELAPLELGGLSEEEVLALTEATTGNATGSGEMALGLLVHRETAGNPLFVVELCHHLADTRAAAHEAFGKRSLEPEAALLSPPQSIRDIVLDRVERLGVDARRVLVTAAAIGEEFQLEVLSRAVGLDEGTALELIEAGVEAGLLAELTAPGWFRFRHALVAHALYAAPGATRRSRTHRQIASILEEFPDRRAAEIARHWIAARSPGEACVWAERAGREALSELAPADAANWFGEALAFLEAAPAPDGPRHVDLLVGLGTAQRQAGDPVFQPTLLDAARRARALGDNGRLVAAALASYRGLGSAAAVDQDRVEILEAALDAADDDTAEQALLSALLANELLFDANSTRRLCLVEDAHRIADQLGDPAILVAVSNLTFEAWDLPYTLGDRLARTAAALDLAARLNDPLARFLALVRRKWACDQAGLMEESVLCLSELTDLAARVAHPLMRWQAAYLGCAHALSTGDLAEAERLAGVFLELSERSGLADSRIIHAGLMGRIRSHQGRLEEMPDTVKFEFQVAEELPHIATIPATAAYYGYASGHRAEAQAIMRKAAAVGFGQLPRDNGWTLCLVYYAEIAAASGATAAAADLYTQLAAYADQYCFVSGLSPMGSFEFHLGLLAAALDRPGHAAEHFSRAVVANERISSPYWASRARVELARTLMGDGGEGRSAQAAELLHEAAKAARAHGFAGISRDVAGLRPPAG